LSSSPLSPSPLLLPPKMASPTVLTSKDKEYLQPPCLLWKCGCDVWVSESLSPTLSSSWPWSEDEPKRCSESGDNQIGGTGTCLCLNQTPEGDLFLPRQTLLRGTILAKDDCGCEHDMTWKNQQMEIIRDQKMSKSDYYVTLCNIFVSILWHVFDNSTFFSSRQNSVSKIKNVVANLLKVDKDKKLLPCRKSTHVFNLSEMHSKSSNKMLVSFFSHIKSQRK
jgi:hypothetical protein